MERKYLTVTDVTKYLKYKFDSDMNLQTICIKGEISNFKKHASGLYFSLKDEEAVINASMFKGYQKNLNFEPTDGAKVLVVGRISIYPKSGRYQINVIDMILDGMGNLYLAFEKLKQDLYKEGLFNKEHKKRIPKFPKRVGVITAPTGAAVRDIISTIKRRCPITEVILFPSLVQGNNAASDIVRNIKLATNYNLDVLIVGRGGGSIEDLWPFNEEIVARAIYDCPIPVISGTGHEPDITIADYVCDHRAPTPTGAAEACVPVLTDVINYVDTLETRLYNAISNKIKKEKIKLQNLESSYVIKTPELIYENKLQQLDLTKEKLDDLLNLKLERSINNYKILLEKINYVNPINLVNNNFEKLINIEKNMNILIKHKLDNLEKNNVNTLQKLYSLNPILKIEKYKIELENNGNNINRIIINNIEKKKRLFFNSIDKLELLNPLTILKRGYSITYIDNKVINDINKVKINDILTIQLDNGKIIAKTTDIKGE